MLRVSLLTAVLSASLTALLFPVTTSAQASAGCFMRGLSGRTVPLTHLCPSPIHAPASSPSQFTVPSFTVSSLTVSSQPQVFQAKIKRREGRTPVIEVTFNGKQPFEMIVDTGASGSVITQAMAKALGVVPAKKVKFNTATAKEVEMPLGRVRAMAVEGAIAQNVWVAIAGPELEIGLLGHDFFGNYDITIKQDIVEFRIR
ncbi:MAG: retropepsin-like aspartic protease [Leptolyngbyaceae bacterium]|nr:retropepsin-like aspartic protease [Leptolyngbyaceae bacterium]